ncbi:AMP binding protein [Mycena indigotica]|uniref:AMP binding protein n=1 Tax=Mycena indigotica TaxID=2126181 RepID=A0A8H6WEU3_9AGAR|nr:AMP binding protein [Mycena indigotica]KAF7316064.1 AMP binding protein [Mycena indigotica]
MPPPPHLHLPGPCSSICEPQLFYPSTRAKAFIDGRTGTTITRGQLKHLCLSLAYGLKEHPTTSVFAKRGDTVLIFSPNSLAWPVLLHGSLAAGLRCTLANSAYTPPELAHQYTDSGAKLILAAQELVPVVLEMLTKQLGLSSAEAGKRIVVVPDDLSWAGGPASPRPDHLNLVDLLGLGTLEKEESFDGVADKETALLCYSSGTTGKPKVRLEKILFFRLCSEPPRRASKPPTRTLLHSWTSRTGSFPPLRPEQTLLAILPFYHIYGITNVLNGALSVGATAVIQTRFEPVEFCRNIERYTVGYVLLVPPVLVVLARHPAVDQYDLSSLEYLLSGAAPLGADLMRMVQKRLLSKRKKGSKCLITQGYGLTETSPSTHTLDFKVCEQHVGSIGQLLATLEARLVADDEGDEVVDAEVGKRGELWIRGKTVMKGYLNNPTATNNSITPDKWFKTGDIAIRDKDGYYFIVDRKKELIKYKGFQVPPAELEAILLTHPDIADAAVIGVNSVSEATELPRAYVVHANPTKVNTPAKTAAFSKSVQKWMESKVAKHKFLRGGVAVVDAIPKSAAGKILRKELREVAKQEAERGELGVKAKL